MLYRSTDNQNITNISTTQKSIRFTQHHYQHGAQFSILLAFPSESLTHITCFLDPPALLALSRTNKYLNKHVEDDNTWHRAFVCCFLGISPEGDLQDAKTLMLRRCEISWKKEFIIRYNLRRRWERSHNTTVTHTPHHSAVTSMHLMPEAGLLTSSIQYGIVSRSLPVSGKILRGFLDTSGTGLGIGNPNAEFTPNVSTCALSSDGGTARIIWGFQTGEVALMAANRVMDNSRAAAKLTRCKTDDEHNGSVQHAVWVSGDNLFVTGALDGRVKLWDTRRVKCIWTSEGQDRLVADPCEKVAVLGNFIVSAMKSGEIYLWAGLETASSEDASQSVQPLIFSEIRIPKSVRTVTRNEWEGEQVISALYLADSSRSHVSILTGYANHPYFYRLRVDVDTTLVESTQFGAESFGSITAIEPYFSNGPEESSFVIAGDQLGCVSVYDWNASSPLPKFSSENPPSSRALHKFEAHEDGAVTAIAWNSITLVTGSSRGTVKVWDSLTFTPLRCFSSPAAKPPVGGEWDVTGHIILKRDLLVVSVGSRVMAWKAGPACNRGQSAFRGKHAKKSKKSGPAKGYQQLELYRDISESRQELDYEQTYFRRAYGREKEQRSTLDDLGLDEIEAVEYVLMLSRDEEEARSREQTSVSMEEGVFEGDFDGVPTRAINVPTSSSFRSQGPTYNSGRSLPRTSPPKSNHKVQVFPHFRREPMEAVASSSISMDTTNISSLSPDHFPLISPTTSNSGTPDTSWARRSASGSPGMSRSAWSSPRRSAPPSEVSSPGSMSPPTYRAGSTRSMPGDAGRSAPSASLLLATDLVSHASANDDASDVSAALRDEMDEDIKFAIELSLIEARSRGENV